MTTISSTELKTRPGQVMDMVKRGPVRIQSHGRDVAVILDHEEYARLQAIEDAYWASRAEAAKQEGFLTSAETETLAKELLGRED